MKKILLLLLLQPFNLFSQYIKTPTNYNSQLTSEYIISGNFKNYLKDTIEYNVERRNGKFVTHIVSSEIVNIKLNRLLKKGTPKYLNKTSGGYEFTIIILNADDNLKVVNYCTFYVDTWTQKIKSIDISKDN